MSEATPFHNTRISAARAGEKFYQGAACKSGHTGLRYTSTGKCVECARVQAVDRAAMFKKIIAGTHEA